MITRNIALAALLVLSIALQTAFAGSGADLLLNSVGGQPTDTGAKPSSPAAAALLNLSEFKINDPFTIHLFTAWQTSGGLPFDVNLWIQKILKADHAQAAHLYSAIKKGLPGSFEETAEAAQAYLYWKLGLEQVFFDHWTTLLSRPTFATSPAGQALEQAIAPEFDAFLQKSAVMLNAEQETVIRRLTKTSQVYATMKAFIAMRTGIEALHALEQLPEAHFLKAPLSRTVSLAYARKGDLASAARVLKNHLEPWIEATHNTEALSQNYLEIARLLFQAGSMEGAAQLYSKIPNTAPEYLTAREELTWVRLRGQDTARLRGDLTTLSLKLYDDKFTPELFVVRAISNLKLCYYDQAEKDFASFIRLNGAWAKKITQSIDAQDPPMPRVPDYYARRADEVVAKRMQEAARLEQLGKESISASLPAVGWQLHWTQAKERMVSTLGAARKLRADEFRRHWAQDRAALSESIRKMQFVRVELMSQVQMLATRAGSIPIVATSSDTLKTAAAAPVRAEAKSADMSFPFDGVVWPDELFRLRSIAQTKCLESIAN